MKDDPLLPRTQIFIRQEVEVWPHRPDPDGPALRMLQPGATIWVRTWSGRIRQLQLRLVRRASRWGKHHHRRFVVGHDSKCRCHTYWLTEVIRVQSPMKELNPWTPSRTGQANGH